MRKSKLVVAVACGLLMGSLAFPGSSDGAQPVWRAQGSRTAWKLKGITFFDNCRGIAVGEEPELDGDNPTTYVRTTNGGRTWFVRPTGYDELTLNVTQFVAKWRVFAAGENLPDGAGGPGTILRSDDGGLTWTNLSANAPAIADFDYHDYEGISFISRQQGWLAESLYGGVGGAGGAIIHTSNGGATWDSQVLPDPTQPIADVSFVSALNGWAVTDGGAVLHTTNGGAAGAGGWAVQFNTGTAGQLERVKFLNALKGVVVDDAGHYWWTNDGGITWTDVDASGISGIDWSFNGIAYSDPTHLWIVGENETSEEAEPPILFSSDGGATFVQQNGAPGGVLNAVTAVGDRAWAAGQHGSIIANKSFPCNN